MTLDSIAASIVSEISKTVNLTLGERERIKTLIIDHVEPLLWQPCLSFTEEDQVKNAEQRQRMFDLLKSRGAAGATNVELNAIAINHTARISELRQDGYLIQCKRLDGRIWNYRLGGEFA